MGMEPVAFRLALRRSNHCPAETTHLTPVSRSNAGSYPEVQISSADARETGNGSVVSIAMLAMCNVSVVWVSER